MGEAIMESAALSTVFNGSIVVSNIRIINENIKKVE